MGGLATTALIFCFLTTATHILTIVLAICRVKRKRAGTEGAPRGPFTIIRPVCGLDNFEEATLRSTFALDASNYEVIFCAARRDDKAVPLVRSLIEEHPHIPARLLIGDDCPTSNPKLNNIVKGWAAARHEWIAIADNNVLMPSSYLNDMAAAYQSGVGLVCAPPIGSRPQGLWSEIECAFLNTYQARWQLSADSIGFGFAQGKSMLWNRSLLDEAGGIVALGREIAEDAAATKIVRSRDLNVRIVDRPFEQPLGYRVRKQVWDRQVRWARLRRATFRVYYAPEIATGSAMPILAGVASAFAFDVDPFTTFAALTLIWFGGEALLAKIAGWHLSWKSPLAWVLRDLALPVIWLQGWSGDTFVWRGNDMTVAKAEHRPALAGIFN